MKIFNIDSFESFHKQVLNYEGQDVVFRGVKDESFELIPKIGRPNLKLRGEIEKIEKEIFTLFKERAIQYLSFEPRNQWEWLALAQHHGLPTRLLDWTRNPLVAAYFAVEEEHPNNSAVYILKMRTIIIPGLKDDPLVNKKFGKYFPAHFTKRIIAQTGLFTIHPNPQSNVKYSRIDKIIIMNNFRKEFKNILHRYGINRASLFPDLDGLSQYISWLKTYTH